MDAFQRELNALMVETYRSILKVEEGMLRQQSQMDLSIGEMHMIEAIAKEKEKGRTITDIAQDQSLSLPTVTVAINKLARKGYVEKIRDDKDGRWCTCAAPARASGGHGPPLFPPPNVAGHDPGPEPGRAGRPAERGEEAQPLLQGRGSPAKRKGETSMSLRILGTAAPCPKKG